MKKSLFMTAILCAVGLMWVSCAKETIDEDIFSDNPYESFLDKTWTNPHIDYARATELAQNAPSFFEPGYAASKSSEVMLRPSEPIMNPEQTKSEPDTLMYVFNYENGGYVIISTDARIGDVIAYVEEGSFDIKDTVNDSHSAFLVGMMIDYHKRMRDVIAAEDLIADIEEDANVEVKSSTSMTWASKSHIGGPNCAAAERKLPRSPDDLVIYPAPPQAQIQGDEYYRQHGCIMGMKEVETTETSVGPYLITKWGQGEPYNNEAPLKNGIRCDAGCVAIALSQIMAYHSSPSVIPSGGNFAGETTNLFRHRKYPKLERRNYPPLGYESLPKFIRRVGDELNNKWGTDGTTANAGNFWALEWGDFWGQGYLMKCLKVFGYTSPDKVSNYNFSEIEASLNLGRPVYISGSSDKIGTKGHGWVIDGFKYRRMKEKFYYYYFDSSGNFNKKRMTQEFNPYEYKYVHCNYGWDGISDGYYADGIFDTNAGPAVKGEPYNYGYNLRILPNIRVNQ